MTMMKMSLDPTDPEHNSSMLKIIAHLSDVNLDTNEKYYIFLFSAKLYPEFINQDIYIGIETGDYNLQMTDTFCLLDLEDKIKADKDFHTHGIGKNPVLNLKIFKVPLKSTPDKQMLLAYENRGVKLNVNHLSELISDNILKKILL